MEENGAKLNLSALVGGAKDTSNNNTSEEKPTASEVLPSQNIQDNNTISSPTPEQKVTPTEQATEKKESPHISLSIPQSPESSQGKSADTSPTPEQKVTPTEQATEKKESPHISLSIPKSPESSQGKSADTSPTPEQKVTPSEQAPEKKESPHISLSIPQSPESIQGKPADTSPTPEQKVTPSEELAGPRISFFAMQKKKEETTKRGEEKKAQEAKQNNSVSPLNHEKPAELFNNYTPSFDGRAKKLFRQLREISMQPKTRTSLLIALIVGTIGFISYLFVTHPEKHSFKIYKDSIVEAFQKKPSQEVARNTTNTDIPSPVETGSTETGSTSLNGNTGASDSTSTPTPSEEETKKKEIEKLRNEKIRAYFSK